MATDTEVILNALQKEREELHEKIMQVDRIIKRVKDLEYSHDIPIQPTKELKDDNRQTKAILSPKKVDIKVIVLRAFDVIGQAAKLKDIQAEYNNITGNKYNIRETVRSLNKAGLIKIMREKDNVRGYLWIKAEWLDNGQLADKYKPEGFDMLYSADNIAFE